MGLQYDQAGNLTNDGSQTFKYDATGQSTSATYTGYSLLQSYDGDGLRVKKIDGGTTTYYVRSSLLGGQVALELDASGVFQRGYVYLGGEMLAVQQSNQVSWVHQDPLGKSKRVTNSAGTVVSTIELDPWGGNTNRSASAAFQPHQFTSYERDGNASDEAMFRRYNRWWSRFDQPDPHDGSYEFTDPQSFNRYNYVQNDPVNFVDPTGLRPEMGGCGDYDQDGGWHQTDCSTGWWPRHNEIVQATRVGDSKPSGGAIIPTLSDAMNLADTLLSNSESACARLFSNGNGLAKLRELRKKGDIRVKDINIHLVDGREGKLSSFRDISAVARGNTITFNPSGVIVQGKGIAQYPKLSPLESFGAALIHELLHVTGDFPLETGNRDQSALKSIINTADVVTACFPEKE